jgi:hypothetical protein
MKYIIKVFELVYIIWILSIIIFCISSFIQISIGLKFGRQSELFFGRQSELFDFVLSANYLLLLATHKKNN